MTRSRNSRRGKQPQQSPPPKKVGNTSRAGCSHCNPQLNKRLALQTSLRNQMIALNKSLKLAGLESDSKFDSIIDQID